MGPLNRRHTEYAMRRSRCTNSNVPIAITRLPNYPTIQLQASGTLRLRPLPPEHQRVEGGTHVDAAFEHLGHLRGDRQLDAKARAERQRDAGRSHALRDHLHAGQNLVELATPSQLDADVPVAA